MSTVTLLDELLSFVGRFSHWWRNWSDRRRVATEFDHSDAAEKNPAAKYGHPIECVLPGKWPDKHVSLSERGLSTEAVALEETASQQLAAL